MTKPIVFLSAAVLLLFIAAAPPLFKSASESKWTVNSAGKPVGSVTLLTDSRSVRAEWKPASTGATVVMLGANGKLWVRTTGGDVELSSYKGGLESSLVPALMLPITTKPSDNVETKDGKVASYSFGSVKATYKHDSSGPVQVEATTGGKKYALARSSVGKPPVSDPSLYAIRPKKSAAGQISRLAGDLFGASDPSVSATAGARGVGRGVSFADGGNYPALIELEETADQRKARMEKALQEFQREGKVGPAREESQ